MEVSRNKLEVILNKKQVIEIEKTIAKQYVFGNCLCDF